MPRNFYDNRLLKTKESIQYPFIMLSLDYLDYVTYVRADMPDKKIKVTEKDFISFIANNWYIEDLDTFETVFYQFKKIVLEKSGKWFEFQEDTDKYKLEDLYEFKKKDDEEKENLDKTNLLLDKTKGYIDSIFQKNKDNRWSRWKS